MPFDTGNFATVPFAVALCLPAAILGAMTFLRDAPAEWARDALIVWTCVAAMLIAGGAASVIGAWSGFGFALAAFAALAVSGPWGLLIAAGVATALVAGQLLASDWPFHAAVAPALAICAGVGAIRSLTRS